MIDNETIDNLIREAAEAGFNKVLGYDYATHEVVNLACDICEIAPDDVSTSLASVLTYAYRMALLGEDSDHAVDEAQKTSTYRFLTK